MSWLTYGGYGIYVWPSYGATFLVLGWLGGRALWQHHQILKAKTDNG